MLRLGLGLSRPNGAASAVYTGFETYLDFKNQVYAYQGTSYALASLPSYAQSAAPTLNATGLVVTSNKTLSAAVNSVTSDQDFIVWVVANYAATSSGTNEVLTTLGSAGNAYLNRATNNELDASMSGAGVYSAAGATIVSGRAVLLYRRRGAKDTAAVKVSSTVTIGTESATTTLPAMNSTLNVGNYPGGGFPAQATIEFVGMKLGSFSDAQLTTILTAA